MKFKNASVIMKSLRKQSGLTQQQLGAEINQHGQMVSNVERSLCFYPKHILKKVCKVLKIDRETKEDLLYALEKDYAAYAAKTFGKLLK